MFWKIKYITSLDEKVRGQYPGISWFSLFIPELINRWSADSQGGLKMTNNLKDIYFYYLAVPANVKLLKYFIGYTFLTLLNTIRCLGVKKVKNPWSIPIRRAISVHSPLAARLLRACPCSYETCTMCLLLLWIHPHFECWPHSLCSGLFQRSAYRSRCNRNINRKFSVSREAQSCY